MSELLRIIYLDWYGCWGNRGRTEKSFTNTNYNEGWSNQLSAKIIELPDSEYVNYMLGKLYL